MAAGDPLVSFVVPTYNVAQYLPDCLEGILRQTLSVPFEVVLLDDASTDDTEQVARSFTDPRIRYIRHARNRGHAVTINEAMGLARGAYIARIDSDDRYRPDFLAATLPILERYPDVGVVFADVALIDSGGQVTVERSGQVPWPADHKGSVLCPLLERNFICAATVIGRREAWLATLPVPEWLAFHDWYFTALMARQWEFYYVDRVLADYRVHATNYHTLISRNKTEEPSIFWLLDRIFGEAECDPRLEQEKQRGRGRVYGAQYLTLADKYFGHQLDADARRCYLRALRHRPEYVLRLDVLRHLAATLVGRRPYELGKTWLKTALSRG